MNDRKPRGQAPEKADDARERVLRAAFEAFSEKGYSGASTLLIASRAKVSKRDLYAMFPTKASMLVACITSRSQKMDMPEGLSEPEDRQMLAATLGAFAANFLVETLHPDVIGMYRLAIAEAVRSPEVAQMLQDARQAHRAILTDLFARAQGKGLLPPGDAAEMALRYFALTSEDLILSLLLGGQPPTRSQIEHRAARSAAEFLLIHPKPGATA
jgi:AcrR family transcriptional regulator